MPCFVQDCMIGFVFLSLVKGENNFKMHRYASLCCLVMRENSHGAEEDMKWHITQDSHRKPVVQKEKCVFVDASKLVPEYDDQTFKV